MRLVQLFTAFNLMFSHLYNGNHKIALVITHMLHKAWDLVQPTYIWSYTYVHLHLSWPPISKQQTITTNNKQQNPTNQPSNQPMRQTNKQTNEQTENNNRKKKQTKQQTTNNKQKTSKNHPTSTGCQDARRVISAVKVERNKALENALSLLLGSAPSPMGFWLRFPQTKKKQIPLRVHGH